MINILIFYTSGFDGTYHAFWDVSDVISTTTEVCVDPVLFSRQQNMVWRLRHAYLCIAALNVVRACTWDFYAQTCIM